MQAFQQSGGALLSRRAGPRGAHVVAPPHSSMRISGNTTGSGASPSTAVSQTQLQHLARHVGGWRRPSCRGVGRNEPISCKPRWSTSSLACRGRDGQRRHWAPAATLDPGSGPIRVLIAIRESASVGSSHCRPYPRRLLRQFASNCRASRRRLLACHHVQRRAAPISSASSRITIG